MERNFKAHLQITSYYSVRKADLSIYHYFQCFFKLVFLYFAVVVVVYFFCRCHSPYCRWSGRSFASPGNSLQGEQIAESASLRNTEWATHNCVLGYPVIGECRRLTAQIVSWNEPYQKLLSRGLPLFLRNTVKKTAYKSGQLENVLIYLRANGNESHLDSQDKFLFIGCLPYVLSYKHTYIEYDFILRKTKPQLLNDASVSCFLLILKTGLENSSIYRCRHLAGWRRWHRCELCWPLP